MRIISKGFKHGRAHCEQGGKYHVPDKLGGYFVGCGWATEAALDEPGPFVTISIEEFGVDAPAGRPGDESTLEVDDVNIGQSTPRIGD